MAILLQLCPCVCALVEVMKVKEAFTVEEGDGAGESSIPSCLSGG